MFDNSVIALNIEANSVRGLVRQGRKIKSWGRVPLAPGVVKEGLILQPVVAGEAINSLIESMGVSKKNAIVSITGFRSVHRVISLPKLKRTLLEEAIRREARREMPVPLEELYLFWNLINTRTDEQDFFILGIPRNVVDSQVQTFNQIGIKPQIMYHKPLALTWAIDRRDALIIDLEQDTFNIILVVNNIPTIMRTIIPRTEGLSPADNTRWLIEEITRTMEFHNQGHAENPISPTTPVFLTGELAEDTATFELLKAGIGYPVTPFVPPLECPADMPMAPYVVNLGLTMKKMPAIERAEGTSNFFPAFHINVLPEQYRARRLSIQPLLLSVAVILAIGGIFPVYQTKTDINAETSRLKAESDRIVRTIQQMRSTTMQEKSLQDAIDKSLAAAQTLEQEHQTILARGGYTTPMLQILADTLPKGLSLSSMTMTAKQVTVKGDATEMTAVIAYAKALESKNVFSEVSISELGSPTFTIVLNR